MTTGFITEWGGTGPLDVDQIFAPGDTGLNTGHFSAYRGLDLGRCFAPVDWGFDLGFNTGIIALDGRDLREWFAATGTVVPAWPIGGGFLLQQAGTQRFVTDSVVAYNNRMGWAVYGDGSDVPTTNPIAYHNVACPGIEGPNASLWQDFGGYVRGVTRRLPLGAILRFEFGTINLPGYATVDRTVGLGDWASGWTNVHSGGVNFCSNTYPYYTDPVNFNGFSPGNNLFYGSFNAYMSVASSKVWAMTISAGFSCNAGNPSLAEQRLYVTRIA